MRYEQSIQPLREEIYLLKAPHNGMKFLFHLRLKNTPCNPYLWSRKIPSHKLLKNLMKIYMLDG
jgi:hypothetical protein